MDIEKLREKFKPNKIRVLLVGESPPAGGTFFYDQSLMTTHTKIAFEVALDKKFPTNFEFFEYMKQVGFFLDDLCLVPVNKLPSAEREAKLVEESESFSERVLQMKPEVVVVVLRKIEQIVREALNKVGSTAEVHVLPFPGNGHQNKYKAQLIPIVREHGNRT